MALCGEIHICFFDLTRLEFEDQDRYLKTTFQMPTIYAVPIEVLLVLIQAIWTTDRRDDGEANIL